MEYDHKKLQKRDYNQIFKYTHTHTCEIIFSVLSQLAIHLR